MRYVYDFTLCVEKKCQHMQTFLGKVYWLFITVIFLWCRWKVFLPFCTSCEHSVFLLMSSLLSDIMINIRVAGVPSQERSFFCPVYVDYTYNIEKHVSFGYLKIFMHVSVRKDAERTNSGHKNLKCKNSTFIFRFRRWRFISMLNAASKGSCHDISISFLCSDLTFHFPVRHTWRDGPARSFEKRSVCPAFNEYLCRLLYLQLCIHKYFVDILITMYCIQQGWLTR